MHERISTMTAALAGAVFGAAGTMTLDTTAQIISAISSLACLAFALIRAAIRTVAAIKAHKKGEKTIAETLKEIDDIADEFKKGGGKK